MKPAQVEKRVRKAIAQDKPMNPTFLKWYTGASARQLDKAFSAIKKDAIPDAEQ